MVQPLEWSILKRSWQGSQGTSELGWASIPGCVGPPAEYLSQRPQVTVPHPARFSRAPHADRHVGRGSAAGPPQIRSTWAGGMAHHWPYLRCCRRRSPAAGAPRDAPGQAHGGAHGHCGRRARRRTDAPPSRSDGSCAAGLDLSAAPPLRPGGSCPGPRS